MGFKIRSTFAQRVDEVLHRLADDEDDRGALFLGLEVRRLTLDHSRPASRARGVINSPVGSGKTLAAIHWALSAKLSSILLDEPLRIVVPEPAVPEPSPRFAYGMRLLRAFADRHANLLGAAPPRATRGEAPGQPRPASVLRIQVRRLVRALAGSCSWTSAALPSAAVARYWASGVTIAWAAPLPVPKATQERTKIRRRHRPRGPDLQRTCHSSAGAAAA